MTAVILSGQVVFDSALFVFTVFTNDGGTMWEYRNSMGLEAYDEPYGAFCAL